MDKKEVEMVLIKVKLGQEEALSMKVYKNGIIIRRGCGAVPEIGISTMTFTEKPDTFGKLMETVTQQVCDFEIQHKDKEIKVPLEYTLFFYGQSSNGETGERAQWTKSSGIYVLLDSNSTFRDPIMGFIDKFAMDACELTNSLYFDVMINVMYKLKSSTLSESIMATSKTEKEIKDSFTNYVNQMNDSVRKWDMLSFGTGKTYKTVDGIELKPAFSKKGQAYSFRFFPLNGTAPSDKPWWKIW